MQKARLARSDVYQDMEELIIVRVANVAGSHIMYPVSGVLDAKHDVDFSDDG